MSMQTLLSSVLFASDPPTSRSTIGNQALLSPLYLAAVPPTSRSAEGRVGKECRSRLSPYHHKKKSKICRDALPSPLHRSADQPKPQSEIRSQSFQCAHH